MQWVRMARSCGVKLGSPKGRGFKSRPRNTKLIQKPANVSAGFLVYWRQSP